MRKRTRSLNPHQKLSPDEKAARKLQEEKAQRKRSLIRDQVWPFLLAKTETIADAKVFIQMNSLAINQSFTNLRAKTTVQDIGLMDDLQDTDASVREREFLGMMAGETILDAVSLLEGLERIIAALVDKKASAEPLSSIDIDEIIEK